jgi:hypothetical protein
MDSSYSPQPLPPQPKKNNTVMIIAIVAVVLCCCCLIVGVLGYQFGDQLLQMLGG